MSEMVKYNLKDINTNIYSIRLITQKDRIVQNDISQQMLEIILGMITAVKNQRVFSSYVLYDGYRAMI